MSPDKLRQLLARHDQFLRRVSRMLVAGEKGYELPEDAKFHNDEIKSLDAAATDTLIDLSGSVPAEGEWQAPGSYAFVNGYMKPGELTWLRAYQQGLLRSKNYFEIFLTSNAMEVHMGDKITIGNAQVVMGSGSTARDISLTGAVVQGSITPDALPQLAAELAELRKALRKERDPEDSQHDIELGAVAQAEQAASRGDQQGALSHLKAVGKWCLDVATKIGVSLATDAIKQATGLGK